MGSQSEHPFMNNALSKLLDKLKATTYCTMSDDLFELYIGTVNKFEGSDSEVCQDLLTQARKAHRKESDNSSEDGDAFAVLHLIAAASSASIEAIRVAMKEKR